MRWFNYPINNYASNPFIDEWIHDSIFPSRNHLDNNNNKKTNDNNETNIKWKSIDSHIWWLNLHEAWIGWHRLTHVYLTYLLPRNIPGNVGIRYSNSYILYNSSIHLNLHVWNHIVHEGREVARFFSFSKRHNHKQNQEIMINYVPPRMEFQIQISAPF